MSKYQIILMLAFFASNPTLAQASPCNSTQPEISIRKVLQDGNNINEWAKAGSKINLWIDIAYEATCPLSFVLESQNLGDVQLMTPRHVTTMVYRDDGSFRGYQDSLDLGVMQKIVHRIILDGHVALGVPDGALTFSLAYQNDFFGRLSQSLTIQVDNVNPPALVDRDVKEICSPSSRSESLIIDLSNEDFDEELFGNANSNSPWRTVFLIEANVVHDWLAKARQGVTNFSKVASHTYYKDPKWRAHQDLSIILNSSYFNKDLVFIRSDQAGNFSAPSKTFSFSQNSINSRRISPHFSGCK